MITNAPRRLRVEITKVNEATGNVNTFQFLLKLGPFRRTFKRVVNISQKLSGITQLKSTVTQPVPFNTIRPSNLTQVQPVSRNAGLLAPGTPEHKIHHLPKAMLHRSKLMRRSAGLLQKEDMRGFLNEKLKNVLAVPSHRPDIPGQQREGGIRSCHLSTAQTCLEADTMLDCHVALCWCVFLGNVPSSSQSKWSANPLQDHHNWQCAKDHSGTSNLQPSSKAEDETDRCGATCHKQHNDVVELEHAQRLSSNPWSLLSTDVHILACVHSNGP